MKFRLSLKSRKGGVVDLAQFSLRPEPASKADVASGERRVLVGTVWTGLGFLSALLAGPALTVLLVRAMPSRAYGILVTGMAIGGLGHSVANMGLAPGVAQIAAREEAISGEFGLVQGLRLGMSLARRWDWAIAVLGVGLVLVLMDVPSMHLLGGVVLVLMPWLVMAPFVAAYQGYYQASHRGRILAASATTEAMIMVAGVGVALTLNRNSPLLAASARTIAAFALLFILWRRRPKAVESAQSSPVPGQAKRLAALSISMLLGNLAAVAIYQLDVIVVGIILGAKQTALYAPLSKTTSGLISLGGLADTFLLPVLVRSVAAQGGSRSTPWKMYHWASRWSFVVASPVMGCLLVAPGPILELLYGSKYGLLIWPMRLLTVGALVQIGFGYNAVLLDAYGAARPMAVRAVFGLGVDVSACAVLIPWFHLLGAAMATLLGLIAFNLASSSVLLRQHDVWPADRSYLLTVSSFLAVVMIFAGIESFSGSSLLLSGVSALVSGLATLSASMIVSGPAERSMVRGKVSQAVSRAVFLKRDGSQRGGERRDK